MKIREAAVLIHESTCDTCDKRYETLVKYVDCRDAINTIANIIMEVLDEIEEK